MLKKFMNFANDEGGAITADWVVITAGVVGLGALMYYYMHEPLRHVDEQSGQVLASVVVETISFE
nr:hypothetical protein [Ruegeria arenilitoris]